MSNINLILSNAIGEAPALEAPALEAPALEAPALEAPAAKAPAAKAPALPDLPVVDWLQYLEQGTSKAFRRAVDAAEKLVFGDKREATIEQVALLVGYTLGNQLAGTGQDSRASRVIADHADAKGRQKAAMNAYRHGYSQIDAAGRTKMPEADKVSALQDCYAAIVAAVVDSAAIRKAEAFASLTDTGLSVEQALEKQAADKAARASARLKKQAEDAGYILASQIVPAGQVESEEIKRLQGLLDDAHEDQARVAGLNKELRSRLSAVQLERDRLAEEVKAFRARIDLALSLKSLKAAREYLAA